MTNLEGDALERGSLREEELGDRTQRVVIAREPGLVGLGPDRVVVRSGGLLAERRVVVLVPGQPVVLRVRGLGAGQGELQDARVEAEVEVVLAHVAQLGVILVGLSDEVHSDRSIELVPPPGRVRRVIY